jgi:2'-hydroxyisoflavone reductase
LQVAILYIEQLQNNRPSMTSRRDFLRRSTQLGGALLASRFSALHAATGEQSRPAPLNILVLGGTGYIGPHFVRHAVSRGHKVTIFTRGRRDAEIPGSVERLVGDRMINDTIPRGNLTALERRRWDVVIDDSATDPRWVAQSATLLKDSGLYLFVSSTGVFDPYVTDTLDESGPVRLEPANSREFAVQKAQCEKIVLDTFGARGIVVRPTYIVGPGDTSDRFPYWPQRLARGGQVLAPGRKSDPVQIIDVRDLAEFKVKLIEDKKTGIYNVAGPRERLTMEQFLTRARSAINSNAEFVWIEDYDFLSTQRIAAAIPWLMLRGNALYATSIRNTKAVAAGLTFRPLEQTVGDTLAWWGTVPEARKNGARFWITADREREVLAAWKR